MVKTSGLNLFETLLDRAERQSFIRSSASRKRDERWVTRTRSGSVSPDVALRVSAACQPPAGSGAVNAFRRYRLAHSFKVLEAEPSRSAWSVMAKVYGL